ncbi:hypothetical protein OJ996_11850 [Luteolibacter sp. GHJ8]|uniref:HEAT repeat protein n=1 Tax=Luteolibacter rhizosphaerae TaxID=2989719 RepID=A0ABT3G348_9BACT|nr:hypothetical protein [Luteolibacter rhizosphaerae]MCW1914273.1 hypothetical protein [Luteolibacter rhizosphaerae]
MAKLVADPATSRLLATFDELASGTTTGEPNKKLVEACRGTLMDNDGARRSRNFALLLELARAEDAPAIHAMFAELHQEGRAFDEYKTFAMRWGMVAPTEAMEFLKTQHQNGIVPRGDLRAIAFGWGRVDPDAALKWMNENPGEAERFGGNAAVVDGWLKTDPVAAAGWVAANGKNLDPNTYLECVRWGFSAQIFSANTDLAGAAAWLSALPDDEISSAAAENAWGQIQWALGELSYDKSAELWGKVGNEPWMGFEQFVRFSGASSTNKSADRGVDGFLDALGRNWPEDKVSSQFEHWSEGGSPEVEEWLAGAPSTPVTKAAIRGLIRSLEKSNPDAVASWTQRLGE